MLKVDFWMMPVQGLADAETNLGVMYVMGREVEKDVAKAMRWFERAAAKGDERAKRCLAEIRSLA